MTTTLDPAKTSSLITLSNSNRTATRTSGTAYYATSLSESSDAATVMYAEAAGNVVYDSAIGVANGMIADSPSDGSVNWMGFDTNSIGLFVESVWHNGAVLGSFALPPAATDVIGVFVNRTDQQLWFYNATQGIWLPDGPGFPITSLGSGPLYLGFSLSSGDVKTANFDGTFAVDILAQEPSVTRWDGTPINPVFTTMPAAKGTLALTRNDAVLRRTYVMPAVKATLALTGIAAVLKRAVPLVAATRAFVLTGIAAGLNKAGARSMQADRGVFTLTGNDAGLAKTTAYQMAADAGALVLTGMDAALQAARRMVADAGAIALTGNAVNLVVAAARKLLADVGALLLTGMPASLVWQPAVSGGYTLNAATGTVRLTGITAVLRISGGEMPSLPGALNFGRRVFLTNRRIRL